MTNNFAGNVEQIKPAVVMILAETNRSEIPFTGGEYIMMSDKVFSKGTGFIVTEDGFILTANHVVREAKDKIQVRIMQDNKFKFYEAKLISENVDADVALLKIEGEKFPNTKLGEYNEFKEGMSIGFIGFPLTMNLPITNNGIISGIGKFQYEKDGEVVDIYTLNAFINQGNSGGPVFSADTGEVIGIINARMNVINENQFLKLPPDYSPIMRIGGIDPITLSVETYNSNLKFIGDVTQVGIGYSTSIEYGKELLKTAR
ncbi:MAG TPA: serine protease [Desulfobacteria bacterium]|nr:serine protease [Desulfobacteria bacterium]